jgi:uncharacterized protein YbaP (TraB family)
MLRTLWLGRLLIVIILASALSAKAACVWKVSGSNGEILYLGGSVHALRSTDYPLPSAYNQAFDASSRLVFEADPKESEGAFKEMSKAGRYPKGDTLRNHVDPRTYDYLRKFFALRSVSENQFNNFRPWFIDLMLESPPPQLYQLGVEKFLANRAVINRKPIIGLESRQEHNRIFTGLSDRDGEAILLLLFINAGREDSGGKSMIDAWRHGDVDTLARSLTESYREFPAFSERLLGARNRNWIPKIESYLHSGKTHFVVVGAGHMGGPEGLLALLRGRGYHIEQL